MLGIMLAYICLALPFFKNVSNLEKKSYVSSLEQLKCYIAEHMDNVSIRQYENNQRVFIKG